MSSNHTSTSNLPPTLDNPVGTRIVIASTTSFALVVIFVFLRLFGRWRQRQGSATLGESQRYVQLSDLTIVVSLLNTAALLGIILDGVRWGLGLHTTRLSQAQANHALKAFFLYQIIYKFAAGISKIATCLILLAITSPHQTNFIFFCRATILFILGYCVTCAIVTIFQCGLDIESNWIHSHDQSHCLSKPPFWYAHAGLNIFASLIVAILPWWLFSALTYKRKYVIGVMLTGLALGEVIFGAVRLRGLYMSAHSAADLTFGASTGVIVSQLEVSFACIAACVPTVIKISEELYVLFCVRVLRLEHMSTRKNSASTGTGLTTLRHPVGYTLSSIDRTCSGKSSKHAVLDRSKSPFKTYFASRGGVEEGEEFQEDFGKSHRLRRDSEEEGIISEGITVKREYHVSRDDSSLSDGYTKQ